MPVVPAHRQMSEVTIVAGTRTVVIPRRKLRSDLPTPDNTYNVTVADSTFSDFLRIVSGEFLEFSPDLKSLVDELGFENKITLKNEILELQRAVSSSESIIDELQQNLAELRHSISQFNDFDTKIKESEARIAHDMEQASAFTKNELDSLKAAVLAIRSRSSFPVPGRAARCVSLGTSRSMPRIPGIDTRDFHEFNFSGNGFDGIIAFLTREYGGNIVDQEIVKITARDGSGMKYIVDFNDVESNYCSKNIPEPWFCIDFLKRRVVPSNYTFRSYAFGGKNYFHPKSWVVEISMDGKEWTVIDRRTDNQDLNGASKSKTFPVSREKTDECQYIRVRSEGPNHSGKYHLVCAGFEVFGTLYD